MRVVIASRIFAPEAAAASFRLAALASSLHQSGAEVIVLTSRTPDGSAADVPAIAVRRAPVLRDKSGAVRGYIPYLSFDVPLFFRLLFVKRPNVVVVEPPPTTGAAVRVVCALRRIPYVYYAADILSDAAASAGAPRVIVRLVRGLERWVLRGASVVLSVSAGVTARLAEFGVTGTVQTIGNGVDTVQFGPTGTARDLGAPYLLYAGTASEVHGAIIFLEAFRTVLERHPNARLVFVGQGSEREEIEALAAQLPIGSVVFEPRSSAVDVSEWLRGASASLASVRPGLGYDFAFPTKMYAAVACGTPVLYAGEGPGRAFASDPNLGSAACYETDAVARAMIAALETPVDGESREIRADWARSNISLGAVAARALTVIRDLAP